MAVDEEAAAALRRAIGAGLAIRERPMFGGLAFLLDGNMLCGALGSRMGGGAVFRVGRDAEAAALAVEGTRPFAGTGRRMTGFVACDTEVVLDEARRDRLLGLALGFTGSLPPK